ncbi:MAG: DUF4157 domain-containing protein [Nitrospirae bacterium]|nr:DUF4157 domain-containing protein [Candidatus Manganitrophaceae bacterium]
MKTSESKKDQTRAVAVSSRKNASVDQSGAALISQSQRIQNSAFVVAQRTAQRRCFGDATMQPLQKKENKTGMPDDVKAGMEATHKADFSDVQIHPSSAKAPEVGALAYTQGTDIHFAPGQFSPNTTTGKSLLGHELTHVVQQREGRVAPTTEVNGMPVNDNPGLEKEADDFGKKAAG